MLVTPRPGVDRHQLLEVLQKLGRGAENLRGAIVGQHAAEAAVSTYLVWANDAARSLRTLISAADVDELVLTRGFERLLTVPSYGSAALYSLLDVEIEDRIDAFHAATTMLHATIERWSSSGTFLVADTSVYIHAEKLEHVDLAELIDGRGEAIHLLLPIVVIDELDGLKRSPDAHTRWRAGYTLGVLDRVFSHTIGRSLLRDEDFSALDTNGIPRGAITVEMVLDPPRHVRLPINDDELIDRVRAIEPLIGRSITLLTYDTGQSTRARAAGLKTIKLRQDLPEEPPRQAKNRRGASN